MATDSDPATLLSIDEAYQRLATAQPEAAAVVRLRVFVGRSLPEAASALGMSETKAKRRWHGVSEWQTGTLSLQPGAGFQRPRLRNRLSWLAPSTKHRRTDIDIPVGALTVRW